MSKRPTAIQVQAPTGRQQWARRLDAAALFLVLVVVGMRPLLGETYYSNLEPTARAAEALGDVTPATTAWLDLAIWTAGLAAAGAALLGRRRWQLTGVEIGAAILVVAATVSTMTASNKRLALNASCNWLTALVLVVTVANLCRDRLRIGLLLSVLAASGLASVTRCTLQKTLEFNETRQDYLLHKAETWARQNVALDDPTVQLFERRLNGAEASGFFPMSNNQAAWLGLAGFACLGLRGLVSRRRWAAMFLLVPAAVCFGMMPFTGSKGAMVSAAGGLVLWLLLTRVQDRLRHRWYLLLIAAWAALAGLVSVGFVYGVTRGGLPTDSLRFRWNYWQVTSDIIAHHLPTGVGALNFDHAYLQAKPVQFPEEIRDPHNFALSIIAQWGILGGIGLLAVFAGASYVAARTWGTREPTDAPPPVFEPHAKYAQLQWIVAVSIGFVLLRLILMRGWLGNTSGAAFVFFDMGLYGLIWIIAFAGLSWFTRGGSTGDIDLCQVACLVAALTFVMHNLIDCAMFFPGTLMPFAALAGVLAASRFTAPVKAADPARGAPIAVAILAMGTVASIALVVLPVTRATALLYQARFGPRETQARAELFQEAIDADPLDPTAPVEMGLTLVALPDGDLDTAIAKLNEGISRDPEQVGLYRARAGLMEMSFRRTGSVADLQFALGAARKVVSMYPNSPDDHIWLADMLVRAAAGENSETLPEALAHYQQALDLDDQREPGELRRWGAQRRRAIQDQMREVLRQATSQPASEPAGAASQPTTGPAR